jgi:hypothetical protein
MIQQGGGGGVKGWLPFTGCALENKVQLLAPSPPKRHQAQLLAPAGAPRATTPTALPFLIGMNTEPPPGQHTATIPHNRPLSDTSCCKPWLADHDVHQTHICASTGYPLTVYAVDNLKGALHLVHCTVLPLVSAPLPNLTNTTLPRCYEWMGVEACSRHQQQGDTLDCMYATDTR